MGAAGGGARRSGGGEGAGRAPLGVWGAGGRWLGARATRAGLWLPAPEVWAAASPGGRPSARLSLRSGRARAAGGGTRVSRRSRRAGLADRGRGRGLGSPDPQTLSFFLLCCVRSPKLSRAAMTGPTVPGGQGTRGSGLSQSLPPRASSSFHSAAKHTGVGKGWTGTREYNQCRKLLRCLRILSKV